MRAILLLLFTVASWAHPLGQNRVDLSYVIDSTIPRWPGFNALSMRVAHNRRPNFTVQTETIETTTHIGTHIDAPIHFNQVDGWTLDQIPQERLSGPAVVIDVQNQTETDPNYAVTVADIERFENESGRIPDKSFVLIRTGLGRFWNDTKKYLGTDTYDLNAIEYPGISGEAAEWLVKERDVLGVGLDTVSLDSAAEKGALAHRKLLGANRIGLENMANLDKLPAKGIYLDVFPLKLKGASGAPAQITAYIL